MPLPCKGSQGHANNGTIAAPTEGVSCNLTSIPQPLGQEPTSRRVARAVNAGATGARADGDADAIGNLGPRDCIARARDCLQICVCSCSGPRKEGNPHEEEKHGKGRQHSVRHPLNSCHGRRCMSTSTPLLPCVADHARNRAARMKLPPFPLRAGCTTPSGKHQQASCSSDFPQQREAPTHQRR